LLKTTQNYFWDFILTGFRTLIQKSDTLIQFKDTQKWVYIHLNQPERRARNKEDFESGKNIIIDET
jgi:urate oxidase